MVWSIRMVRKAWMVIVAALACAGSTVALGQSPTSESAPSTRPEPSTQPAPATQPAPETQPDPEVLRLIDLMAAPKFQTRSHAQADLVKMGAAAEPALKQAADESSSPEIRARAMAAVIQIEENIADSPTYITLHVKRAPLADVLKSISSQSGMRILVDSGAGPITLDLDHVTFWSAIEALSHATGTHPAGNGQGNPGLITLVPGDTAKWNQEGRFAFMPISISHNSVIDLINGGASKNDSIIMLGFLDPRFHSATFDGMQLTVAQDDRGNSLLGPGMFPNFFNFQNAWCFILSSPLNFPETFGHSLVRLEGTTVVRIPMGTDTLKIPDLAKAVGTGVVAGNHRIDVVTCNVNGGNILMLHLQISRLARSSGMNYPGGLFAEFQAAHVVDGQGQQLVGGGGGGGIDPNMQIDWQGQYTTGGRPIKPPFSLTWDITTRVETQTVPFKFKNLPLPPQ
jgi:hypothetical protein